MEVPLRRQILSELVKRAHRRPTTDLNLEILLGFYQEGRHKANFELGIELGLRAILADPEFVTRFEDEPGNVTEKFRFLSKIRTMRS